MTILADYIAVQKVWLQIVDGTIGIGALYERPHHSDDATLGLPVQSGATQNKRMLAWLCDERHRLVDGLQDFDLACHFGLPLLNVNGHIALPLFPEPRLESLFSSTKSTSAVLVVGHQRAVKIKVMALAQVRVWLVNCIAGERKLDMPEVAQAYGLTSRERELAKRLASNCSEQTIAADLRVSEETIRTHRRNIYQKFGVRDRADFILFLAAHRFD